jgi:tetratricopeptide (TPR) repeat protein
LNPPFLSCGCLAATALVSTLFSVDPSTSLSGLSAFGWKTGWLNLCALMLFFFATAGTVRSREQRDRMLTTLLIASLPVSIYAIMQRQHVQDASGRVFSTIGAAIFLGDYLAPLIPLTLWRLAAQWRLPAGSRGKIASALFYVLLAVLQLFAIFLTSSRGSILALTGGLLLWIALSVNYLNCRRLLIYGFGSLCLAGLFLCLLATSHGPLRFLSPDPMLKAIDQYSSVHQGTISYRVHLWRAAAETALSSERVLYPDGKRDRWQYLRPLIGFGLNTQPFVLLQHLSEIDRDPEDVDFSAHNLAWEMWIEMGAFGLLAFASVPVAVFSLALRRLGLINSRKDALVFLIALTTGALGGAFALGAWAGLAFAGVGLQLGCFTGLILFVMAKRTRESAALRLSLPDNQSGLMIVTLSALTICLLCTVTEPATITTLVNYWVMLGLLASLANLNRPTNSVVIKEPKHRSAAYNRERRNSSQPGAASSRGWRPILLIACVVSLLLVTVLQDFIFLYAGRKLSALEVLHVSLFVIPASEGFGMLVWFLIIPAWLGTSWLLAAEFKWGDWIAPRWRLFGLVASVSGGICLLFASIRAWQIANIGGFPDALTTPSLVLQEAIGYELAFPLYLLAMCGLLLVVGCLLSQADVSLRGFRSGLRILAFLVGSSVAAVTAFFLGGLPSIQADVSCHFAGLLQKHGIGQSSVQIYERAVKINPTAFFYREELANALGRLASSAQDYESYVRWNRVRESVLLQAQRGLLVSRSSLMLGRSYLQWAGGERIPQEVHELALRASQALHRATIFDPHNAVVWTECSMADTSFLGQREEGSEEKEKAFKLAEHQGWAYLGDYYLERGAVEPCPRVRNLDAAAAIEFCQEAIRDPKTGDRGSFVCRISIAKAYLILNDSDKAVEVWQESLKNAPAEEIWRSEEFQARLYLSQTNQIQALKHIESAISMAPPNAIDNLTALENSIRAGLIR